MTRRNLIWQSSCFVPHRAGFVKEVLHHLDDIADAEGNLGQPDSMWQATLFEAMLDLLQPGVLKRIAAGLAEGQS
jgi:hypothetical protein